MQKLKIQGTNVLERNLQASKRVVANQGGTGSGKTYALCQLIILLALQETGWTFSILRKSLPTLKASAMRDFFRILRAADLYDENLHNRSDHIYILNGNTIEFFGLDEPFKVRSRRRHILWMNEANEFDLEDWRQLSIRTSVRIYLDYNPSHQYHWLYDEVLTRLDCEIIPSTYKDNPFLPRDIVREIEGYRDKDQNYWRIYGLGERGVSQSTIYTHWQLCETLPEGEVRWGLDFGYNNPTALTKIVVHDQDVYCQEVLYESKTTNAELIEKMKALNIGDDEVKADAEDPQRIAELVAAGFNVMAAEKGKDSVRKGIDALKSRNFYVTKDSANGIKELKSYSWKEKDGKPVDEPVKARDHFCDSVRYAVWPLTQEEPELIIV